AVNDAPLAAPEGWMFERIDYEAHTGQEQRNRQQLTHRCTAPQKPELRVRFAEEFAGSAGNRIADGKTADNQAGPLERSRAHQQRQYREQDKAFQGRFIELARMARNRPAAGKYHRPGNISRAAPQFAIDEIGNSAEKQPNRSDRAGNVAERKDRDATLVTEQKDSEDAADKAAVERHTAVP